MAWLGTWEKRRKITINNTNIDSALSDFPILVKISASSGTGNADVTDIFSELGSDANRKKIAITTDDGETQCYVEIERFDYTNSAAWLWVKVPSASDSVGTELYIYYDSSQPDNTTYIGDTCDTPAQSVWDTNFKLVMHMAQDPNGDVADAIKDSTSNVNHGTPDGSMTTADLVDGNIGKAIDLDGVNDEIIAGNHASLQITGAITVEACAKPAVTGRYHGIAGKLNLSPYKGYAIMKHNTNVFRFQVASDDAYEIIDSNSAYAETNRHYVVGRHTGSTFYLYVDGDVQTATGTRTIEDTANDFIIGKQYADSDLRWWQGIADEIRVSNVARSSAWIKATYYSNWDGLVTYGDIEVLSVSLSPFLSTSSIQADIRIEITNNLFTSTSLFSIGEIFKGLQLECPSPMSAQSSLQSATQIEITESLFTSNNSLQSNAEILLSNNLFTSTSSMSIDEIFRGYLIGYPSPMSAQSSLQSAPQIEVNQSLFASTGSLYMQPEFQIFTGGLLSATGSISATITDPFSVAILPRVYTFTLTGAADRVDDIVIPVKSFQSRLKSGDPTYLSVVIPGIDYASEINLRLNGDLVVRMGYLSNGEIILAEIISMVNFENIIIYNGTTNKTITLDGHRTETFISKEINLTGSSYKNLTAGKLRYRCTPNLYVRPGDKVNIDDDSFTIKNITYSVSPELETFEVSE